MTTKFNVGDTVLIKGIVETIYVETTDNKPIYHVRIKGAGTHEAYGIRVKEDVIYCREALKEVINEVFETVEVTTFDDIIAIIDNALPVEPEITNDDLQAAMTESYHLGYELAETKFKRPHGEWKTRTEDNGVNYRFYCSCCDREVKQITDFCPYCGADMRNEADNDKTN